MSTLPNLDADKAIQNMDYYIQLLRDEVDVKTNILNEVSHLFSPTNDDKLKVVMLKKQIFNLKSEIEMKLNVRQQLIEYKQKN